MSYHVVYLYKHFLNFVSQELKAHQVNCGQMPFILYIGKHAGCSPSDVTKALKVDWGYSQRSIHKLVDQNLIVKKYIESNSRKYVLQLSLQGEEIFTLCHQLFQDWDAQFEQISQQEKEEGICCMKKMVASLEGTGWK